MRFHPWIMVALLALVSSVGVGNAVAKKHHDVPKGGTQCHMQFTLSSWSVLYKSGKGAGTITCENGESAAVQIRTQGGGVTFGKSQILNGHGTFTRVDDIHDLFGAYAESAAHAGASHAAEAHAIWNGDIGLAISGTGTGWDFGFNFGAFKITPR